MFDNQTLICVILTAWLFSIQLHNIIATTRSIIWFTAAELPVENKVASTLKDARKETKEVEEESSKKSAEDAEHIVQGQ